MTIESAARARAGNKGMVLGISKQFAAWLTEQGKGHLVDELKSARGQYDSARRAIDNYEHSSDDKLMGLLEKSYARQERMRAVLRQRGKTV